MQLSTISEDTLPRDSSEMHNAAQLNITQPTSKGQSDFDIAMALQGTSTALQNTTIPSKPTPIFPQDSPQNAPSSPHNHISHTFTTTESHPEHTTSPSKPHIQPSLLTSSTRTATPFPRRRTPNLINAPAVSWPSCRLVCASPLSVVSTSTSGVEVYGTGVAEEFRVARAIELGSDGEEGTCGDAALGAEAMGYVLLASHPSSIQTAVHDTDDALPELLYSTSTSPTPSVTTNHLYDLQRCPPPPRRPVSPSNTNTPRTPVSVASRASRFTEHLGRDSAATLCMGNAGRGSVKVNSPKDVRVREGGKWKRGMGKVRGVLCDRR